MDSSAAATPPRGIRTYGQDDTPPSAILELQTSHANGGMHMRLGENDSRLKSIISKLRTPRKVLLAGGPSVYRIAAEFSPISYC